MAYFYEITRRNITIILHFLSVFLCIFALFSMKKALNVSQNPILIGIDQNGTRIITRNDDPVFDSESVNFIKEFTKKLYNFTPKTFSEQVGPATEWIGVKLWEEKKASIISYKEVVEKDQISLQSSIVKILKNSTQDYSLILELTETNRFRQLQRVVKLDLKIRRIERSQSNPYGLEVIDYVEAQVK